MKATLNGITIAQSDDTVIIEGNHDALARPHTKQIEMRGRPMPGWIHVAAEGVKTKHQLGVWARSGVEFTRALPPKS